MKRAGQRKIFFHGIIVYVCVNYLIQHGAIFIQQNYFAHVIFVNEQRDCDVASCR